MSGGISTIGVNVDIILIGVFHMNVFPTLVVAYHVMAMVAQR